MVKHSTPFEALEQLIDKAGSQSELARQLGCSPTAVWKWAQTRRIGADYVLKAGELYGISPSDLRPDLYPRDLGTRFYGTDGRAHRVPA